MASSPLSLTKNLLYWCKKTDNWEPSFEDRPVASFFEVVPKMARANAVFDFDIGYSLLLQQLSQAQTENKESYSDEDAQRFLDEYVQNLVANIATHWVVVPIRGARLSTTHHMGDFVFVGGSRDNKIRMIKTLNGLSLSESVSRAEHLERSRSPGFFDHPLLAIRVTHQTARVSYIARWISLSAIMALQAVYWGYVHPKHVKRSPLFGPPNDVRICEHLAIHATESWRWSHQPLQFDAHCDCSLEWLSSHSHRVRFRRLFEFVTRFDRGSMERRAGRALLFFSKALDTEQARGYFDGMGLTVLYLMIAAETLLLDNDGEKRTRLASLLPRLTERSRSKRSELFSVVEWAYEQRSDYVHAGYDIYPDVSTEWGDVEHEGGNRKRVRLLQKMIGRLLCQVPDYLENAKTVGASPGLESENLWFKYVRGEWTRILNS